jgi:RNA recognition motif-containing protein
VIRYGNLRSKRYGFVDFENKSAAMMAQNEMNGHVFSSGAIMEVKPGIRNESFENQPKRKSRWDITGDDSNNESSVETFRVSKRVKNDESGKPSDNSAELIANLKEIIERFPENDDQDPYCVYLRDLQARRAVRKDYDAIRTDLNLLIDMFIETRWIAIVFRDAYLVMTSGLVLSDTPIAMPEYIADQTHRPLVVRLEEYYNKPTHKWYKNPNKRISMWLQDQVNSGNIENVRDALDLALLASVKRTNVANIFYQAYKALGGYF